MHTLLFISLCIYKFVIIARRLLRDMTRGSGGARSKIFLVSSYCRETKRVDHQRQFSKGAADKISSRNESDSAETGSGIPSWRCNWVPHPRTGIYVPKGHEGVMDDVPKEAASVPTFWLRNVDGVLEKPDPDTSPDHYYQYMHM